MKHFSNLEGKHLLLEARLSVPALGLVRAFARSATARNHETSNAYTRIIQLNPRKVRKPVG